jgi:hypothetical protein
MSRHLDGGSSIHGRSGRILAPSPRVGLWRTWMASSSTPWVDGLCRFTSSQINKSPKLERFNIRSARKWLAKHGDPLAPVLTASSDMLAALESLTRRLPG